MNPTTTDFATRLYDKLAGAHAGQNLFMSAFSIRVALAMCAVGARGETRRVMADGNACRSLDFAYNTRAECGDHLVQVAPRPRDADAMNIYKIQASIGAQTSLIWTMGGGNGYFTDGQMPIFDARPVATPAEFPTSDNSPPLSFGSLDCFIQSTYPYLALYQLIVTNNSNFPLEYELRTGVLP
jgi:hypothetical protein